jgi:hypothetical protein
MRATKTGKNKGKCVHCIWLKKKIFSSIKSYKVLQIFITGWHIDFETGRHIIIARIGKCSYFAHSTSIPENPTPKNSYPRGYWRMVPFKFREVGSGQNSFIQFFWFCTTT